MSNIVQLNFVRSCKMHNVDTLLESVILQCKIEESSSQQATETSLNSVLSLIPDTENLTQKNKATFKLVFKFWRVMVL